MHNFFANTASSPPYRTPAPAPTAAVAPAVVAWVSSILYYLISCITECQAPVPLWPQPDRGSSPKEVVGRRSGLATLARATVFQMSLKTKDAKVSCFPEHASQLRVTDYCDAGAMCPPCSGGPELAI